VEGSERHAESSGSGPVDATFKAIESVAASGSELLLYSVNAITTGTDAQGEVTVRLAKDGRIVNGQGADTDIVVASAKAYLNALNKLCSGQENSIRRSEAQGRRRHAGMAEATGEQQRRQEDLGHRQRPARALVGECAHRAFGDINQGKQRRPLMGVAPAAQDAEHREQERQGFQRQHRAAGTQRGQPEFPCEA
jgi:hypothetical protein